MNNLCAVDRSRDIWLLLCLENLKKETTRQQN